MPPLPFRRALVIANPVAGRGRGHVVAHEVERLLASSTAFVERFETAARGDARARARRLEPDVDLVVSIGGDGTLSEVLAGLPRRDVPVAVLPMGTANVLALDLGLPRSPADLVAMLPRARRQPLDVARVNGEHLCFLVAGVGFDASVVRELERARRGPTSKLAWALAGLRAFARHRDVPLRVTVDGRALDGAFGHVLVSNIVHYGGFDVLDPKRELDDGLFDVYTFRGGSRLGLLAYLVRGALARFPGGDCELVRARRVRIEAGEPVPYQIDGDHRLDAAPPWRTPFELEVEPERFTLLVP